MRNYKEDLEYKKFRYKVKNRDKRICKWPNCGCRKRLQVHHILPWAKYPDRRYDISNGITLCKQHHKMVTGHEMIYASVLIGLIT